MSPSATTPARADAHADAVTDAGAERPTLHRLVLVLALAVFAIGATATLFALPVHEGPDEPGHLEYAFHLASSGERPWLHGETGEASANATAGASAWHEGSMGHHPALYYWTLVATARALGGDVPAPQMAIAPTRQRADGSTTASKHVHWHDEAPPVSAEVRTYRALRGVSVICGLLSLVLLFVTARVLVPHRPAVASTSVVLLACLPQWQGSHAVLDNGALGTTLCFAALALLARLWMRQPRRPNTASNGPIPSDRVATAATTATTATTATEPTEPTTPAASTNSTAPQSLVRWSEALGLGALLGAALATKLTALFLGPIALVVAARLVLRSTARGATLVRCAVAAAVALALFAPFVVQNLARYGEPLATAAHRRSYALSRIPEGFESLYLWGIGERPPGFDFSQTYFPRLGRSLVGDWGWSTLQPLDSTVLLFAIAASIGVLALPLAFVRGRRGVRSGNGSRSGSGSPSGGRSGSATESESGTGSGDRGRAGDRVSDRTGNHSDDRTAVRRLRAAALVVPCAAIVLVLLQVTLYNATFIQPQGRYLFPGLGGLAVLVAIGLVALARRLPSPNLRTALGCGGALALAAVALGRELPRVATAFEPDVAPSPLHASLVGELSHPTTHATTLTPLAPANDSTHLDPVEFAWSVPDGADATGPWTVHLWLADGTYLGDTFHRLGVELDAPRVVLPAEVWSALPAGVPITWQARRVPDRSRNAPVSAAPRTPPSRFVRTVR